MGATLKINSTNWWMPQSGTFVMILSIIADELTKTSPVLAAQIRQPASGFPYLDLSLLDTLQFRLFGEAANRAFERAFNKWDELVGNYFDAFSQLKALILIDSRTNKITGDSTMGRIILQNQSVWEATNWAYDLVLEIIAAQVRKSDKSLAIMLMDTRTYQGQVVCDLRTLEALKLRLFIEPVCSLFGRFGDGHKVSLAFAPEFEREFYPCVSPLYQTFRQDPRISELKDWDNYEFSTSSPPSTSQ